MSNETDQSLLKLVSDLQEAGKGGIGFLIKIVVVCVLAYAWVVGTNQTATQALEQTKLIQSELQNKADKKDIDSIERQLQEIRGYLIKR